MRAQAPSRVGEVHVGDAFWRRSCAAEVQVGDEETNAGNKKGEKSVAGVGINNYHVPLSFFVSTKEGDGERFVPRASASAAREIVEREISIRCSMHAK